MFLIIYFIVFLKSFDFKVWICALFTFILITLAFYKMFSTKFSLQRMILVCYSTVLRQSLRLQPRTISDFILSSFAVGTMLFSNCYSAVLLSFLTFPSLTGVRTIPELATAVLDWKYNCTTYPGTFTPDALATSSDPNAGLLVEIFCKITVRETLMIC